MEAQKLPASDVYLVHINKTLSGNTFDKPVRFSRTKGYNNQPFFNSASTVLYVSKSDTAKKTDIYQYNIYTGHTGQITKSRNAWEYSPQITPDHNYISCVRVENDSITQNLGIYKLSGKYLYSLPNMPGEVGYYGWVDRARIAVFYFPLHKNDFQLSVYNTHNQNIECNVASNVGRCLQKIPGTENSFSYVQKSDTGWTLFQYDIKTGQETHLLNMLPNVEDYTWTPKGSIWCMYEGSLYEANPHGLWHIINNFCGTEVEKANRIAISPDLQFIAFAVPKSTKP